MKRIVAVILWVFFCAQASAGEVFRFSFATLATVVTESAPGVVKDTYTYPWSGELAIDALSTSDGVHDLEDLVVIRLFANHPASEGYISFDYYGDGSSGPEGPASVTFQDGQIVDIETSLEVSGASYSYGVEVNGFTVNYWNRAGEGLPGEGLYSYSATATATLVPITPIPEPSTWVMMGLGLLGVVTRARLRRPLAATRSTT